MNPINYLQEYCQQNNRLLPNYTLVEHKVFSNSNSFTIKVTIGSLIAEGTAPNKKAAKFKAAEKMILLIIPNNGINFTTESNSSSVNSPKKDHFNNSKDNLNTSLCSDSLDSSLLMAGDNFVGKLQEFCVQKKLKIPIYDWDPIYNGPGHRLICKIGHLSEGAAAQNKKIAKQACAEKMWLHLMKMQEDCNNVRLESDRTNVTEENTDLIAASFEKLKIDDNINLESSIKKAKLCYSQQNTGIISNPKDILIKDYHSYLKNSLTPDTLKEIIKYFDGLKLDLNCGVKKYEDIFKKICSLLNVGFEEVSLQTTKNNTFLIAYTMHTIPSCTSIGTGKIREIAQINAIIHSINTIREILQ